MSFDIYHETFAFPVKPFSVMYTYGNSEQLNSHQIVSKIKAYQYQFPKDNHLELCNVSDNTIQNFNTFYIQVKY